MWSNLFTRFFVTFKPKVTLLRKKRKGHHSFNCNFKKKKKNWYQKTLSTQVEVFYVKYQGRESSKLMKKKKITKAD